jgi:hypothetical protein
MITTESVFETIQQLRDELKVCAVVNNFSFVVVNSNKSRFDSKCQNSVCPFRVTAYKQQDGLVHVKQCNMQHSPYCMETKTASTSAIKTIAKPLAFMNVKPKEIAQYIGCNHGVATKYSTAWKALHEMKQESMLEDDSSFQLITHFLQLVEIYNPGSYTSLDLEADGETFYRTFLCLHAARDAFHACRPIIILDACHMKSQYRGIIMCACSHDGEGRIVPLAIAISDKENQDNWMYFVSHLKEAIPSIENPGTVTMGDQNAGLKNAL